MLKRSWSAVVALAVLCGASVAQAAVLPSLLENFTVTGGDLMTPGAPYVVRGTLAVAPGATLTILSGTTVRFDRDARLLSDGELLVQSLTQNIVLRSDLADPAPGSWQGVEIGPASQRTLLDGVVIEDASTAVLVGVGARDGTYTIRRNVLRNFSLYGVQSGVLSATTRQATRMTGTIADNLFENPDVGGGEGIAYFGSPTAAVSALTIARNTFRDLRGGITLDRSSPVITGNRIEQMDVGLQVSRGSPLVTGNRIAGNGIGILRMGGNDTNPIVNGNQISGNITFDYQSVGLPAGLDPYRAELFQDAERNFWGTTDPLAIAAKVSLESGSGNRPVDFVPFLDANGQLVSEDGLLLGVVRPSSGSTRVIAEGSDVLVLSSVVVPVDTTLEIGAGSTVRVNPIQGFGVDGTLRILGRPGALVSVAPLSDTWRGIDIRPGSAGSRIEGTVLQGIRLSVPSNLRAAIDVRSAELTLRDSSVLDFAPAAVAYRDQSTGIVERVRVDNVGNQRNNVRRATGILIQGSDPTVRDCRITEVITGLDFLDGSTSSVVGNTITANNTGILLRGTNDGSPFPRINGNDLFLNGRTGRPEVQNLVLSGDSLTQISAVDARGNYWLATTEPEIRATILNTPDEVDATPAPVDISGFRTAPVNP